MRCIEINWKSYSQSDEKIPDGVSLQHKFYRSKNTDMVFNLIDLSVA